MDSKHRSVTIIRTVAGVLAASFGTGATLRLMAELTNSWLKYEPSESLDSLEPMSLPQIMLSASVVCLVLALPSAILNAFVINGAARLGRPAMLVAVTSGGTIGFAAGFLAWLTIWSKIPKTSFDAFVLCPATGALMGLLYWLIAIGPRNLQEEASGKRAGPS